MKILYASLRKFCLPVLLLCTFFTQAQPGIGISYRMTQSALPVVPVAGYTVVTPLNLGLDVQSNVIIPAGYPGFTFGGINYSGFVVSTNGWMALTTGLANNAASPVANSLPANDLTTGSNAGVPLIAPLWDDLQGGAVSYLWAGGDLWVRWTAFRWQQGTGAPTTLQFLIRLTPATGNIDLVYPNVAYVPTNPSASIGIAGPCPQNFYSVQPSFTTGAIDSTIDNNIITKPTNLMLRFTPGTPANDNCAGAYDLGTVTGTCTQVTTAVVHATASSSGTVACSPSSADDNDVWYSFLKPSGVSDVTIRTSPVTCTTALTGTSIQAFTGACGSLVPVGCSTNGGTPATYAELNLTGLNACSAETIYFRVTGDNDLQGSFNVCIVSNTPATGSTCALATNICSLPYTQTGLSTAGFGNDYDSTISVCHSAYLNGEDYVFSYTPSTNQCIEVNLTNTGSDPGVFITEGCPDSPTAICQGSDEGGSNSASISATLTAGTTYYIIVDNNSTGGSIPFDISVTQISPAIPNDVCASATNLGTVTLGQACSWSADISNECALPSPTAGYPDPACAGFQQGTGATSITGDVWFRFNVNFNGNILIDTRLGTTNPITDGGMAIYSGSCGALTLIACDDNSGTGVAMPGITLAAVPLTQYYVRVWSESATNPGNFQICISSNCAQPNDLPCNATSLTLGSPAMGNITCAGNTNEPPPPSCWQNGTINTVWYTAVVPTSGRLNIKVSVNTLSNTQIAAYYFNGGCANAASSYTLINCNDNTAGCPCSPAELGSELKLTGLTVGATVYIVVDGRASLTGEFVITVVDGLNPYPPTYGQDCPAAMTVCNSNTISVPTPMVGVGSICDPNQSLGGCFSCGERSGIWYTFTVDPPGNLQFTITPGPFTPLPNFDFAIWNVTGQANPCSYISTAAPVRCNNTGASGVGATGLSSAGGTGFSAPIPITAPTTFLLAIRNWNHSPVGHTIDWMGSNIATSAAPLTWNGAADTAFTNGANWNCFSTLTCAKDVILPFTGAGANQPTLSSNESVHDITIQGGVTLRIKSGVTLSICGDLNVYGTMICEPNSTIIFTGNEVQTINGTLTGTNAFANLVINKTGNSVTAMTNIDVTEDFTVQNATSVFSINGKYMKVGGDFTNFNANTTFTNYLASTVEFNGAANQYFTNNNGSLNLNRVIMNKTGGKLYLNGANSTMNIDTSLTMLNGIIVTRQNNALEVNVKWNGASSMAGYTAASYVDGKLRRKFFSGTGLPLPFSVDFPVGDSLEGYHPANITYRTSTVVPNILGYFTSWNPPGSHPLAGPVASECLIATYSTLPLFDHGYWTFLRPNNVNFNGMYRVTLNPTVTAVGNNTGAGWTVAFSDTVNDPYNPASWGLLGRCVITSTAGNVQRDSLNTPATLATTFNMYYAVAQTGTPLPIELISFDATRMGDGVITEWTTASEINNDRFEVERSPDGENFTVIGKVDGCGPGICSDMRSYSLYDNQVCDGIVYYRLKQIDINGMYSYSDPVAVNCTGNKSPFAIHPNPGRSHVFVSFVSPEESEVYITFTDYTGRVVLTEKSGTVDGFNSVMVNVDLLAKGVYFVRMHSDSMDEAEDQVIRFVKN